MTFRQFLERGTPQFSVTGFGKVAGRLGESPTKVGKPQTNPPKLVPSMPSTNGTRKPHAARSRKAVVTKPFRLKGVV